MLLSTVDDLLKLRQRAVEWVLARWRGDEARAAELVDGMGAGYGELFDETAMLIHEFRGRPQRELWAELARLDVALANRGVFDG